jgi:hypothetical protein
VADVANAGVQAGHGNGHSTSPAMTLVEASAATGRPVAALRALLRRDLQKPLPEQRLRARKSNTGEWLIELPADLRQPVVSQAGNHAAHHEDEVESAAGRLAALEQIVAGRLAGLEEALAEARIAAATAVAERDAARTAAVLEAKLLREQLEREMARVAGIERQLEEARRPLWWRWLRSG